MYLSKKDYRKLNRWQQIYWKPKYKQGISLPKIYIDRCAFNGIHIRFRLEDRYKLVGYEKNKPSSLEMEAALKDMGKYVP